MALKLLYKARTTIPVELEAVVPSALRDQSLAQIERIAVAHGNEARALAEFFSISGDPSDGRLEFEGDLSGVHWLGARMDGGSIRATGSVGRHAGSAMIGGELRIDGDAGDFLGVEMSGGLIDVAGDAGELAGGAYTGSRRGMTGGTILVRGNAGREVGRSLRRGSVAVAGSVGEAPGYDMIAGTLLLFGPGGQRPGAGMRRGTIVFTGSDPPRPLPTFRRACRYRPEFLRLCFFELRRLGFPVPDEHLAADYVVFNGDLLSLGKGELLVRAGD